MYPNTQLYINGVWGPSASSRTLPVVNPANGDQIGTVAYAGRALRVFSTSDKLIHQ